MRMRFYFFFLFIATCVNAQVAGREVFQFLNVSTSARQVALGGEVLTLTDDVNQPIWNPAVISDKLDKKMAVNYSAYLAGISIGSVSFAHKFTRRFGTMHGGIKYLNYGTLIGADEEGNETGNFGASDIAVSAGYAYNLPWTNFYIGGNFKLIHSSVASYSSTGVAVDVSVLYLNPKKPYVLTFVVRNIGAQISSFDGTKERLPFQIALGGSYQLENVPLRWYGTINNLQKWQVGVPNPSNAVSDLEGNTTQESISFLDNMFRHFVIGAELFSESAINIRLGYNFRRSKELQLQNVRSFGGLSFGFGLKMNRLKFNYAYSKIHSATNASTFTLQIDLDKR